MTHEGSTTSLFYALRIDKVDGKAPGSITIASDDQSVIKEWAHTLTTLPGLDVIERAVLSPYTMAGSIESLRNPQNYACQNHAVLPTLHANLSNSLQPLSPRILGKGVGGVSKIIV